MRRTRFDGDACPVARTADLLGDWWTPLVLRELLLGRDRFAEIQERLDISRPVLAARLKRLEAEGLIERVRYAEHPPRDAYRPTAKGRAAGEVLLAMWRFGQDWLSPPAGGNDVEAYDRHTGQAIRPRVIDETTGRPVDLSTVRRRMRPVPAGARTAPDHAASSDHAADPDRSTHSDHSARGGSR